MARYGGVDLPEGVTRAPEGSAYPFEGTPSDPNDPVWQMMVNKGLMTRGPGGGDEVRTETSYNSDALEWGAKNEKLFADPKRPTLASLLAVEKFTGRGMTPAEFARFGGDQLLDDIKKYDPDAKLVWSDGNGVMGQEGGIATGGWTFDFDVDKMPKIGGKTFREAGVMPMVQKERLHNPDMYADDPVWGAITDSRNFKESSGGWMQYAPLAIMAIATLGAAVPAMTAYAASVAAANAAATAAATASMSAGELFAARLAMQAPQLLQSQSRGFNPGALVGAAAGASGIPMAAPIARAGMALAQGRPVDAIGLAGSAASAMGVPYAGAALPLLRVLGSR